MDEIAGSLGLDELMEDDGMGGSVESVADVDAEGC